MSVSRICSKVPLARHLKCLSKVARNFTLSLASTYTLPSSAVCVLNDITMLESPLNFSTTETIFCVLGRFSCSYKEDRVAFLSRQYSISARGPDPMGTLSWSLCVALLTTVLHSPMQDSSLGTSSSSYSSNATSSCLSGTLGMFRWMSPRSCCTVWST